MPELPEVLTVGAGGPLESVDGPLAEEAEGGLPAVDFGGLPEGADGLLVGGETLTVEVPGSDTLTSGVLDEDAPGVETLIEGVPEGEAPSSDTLAKGALGADPSGTDTLIAEVPGSDTLTSDALGEGTLEELDDSGAWALAYTVVSSAAHRPASSPTALAPTHRGRGPAVRLCPPWWGM